MMRALWRGRGPSGSKYSKRQKRVALSPTPLLSIAAGAAFPAGIAVTRDLYGDAVPQIFTSEPDTFDEMKRSLENGEIDTNLKPSGSICDALLAMSPGTNTFPVLMQQKAKGLAASDAQV